LALAELEAILARLDRLEIIQFLQQLHPMLAVEAARLDQIQ
jgi:hypothetical protein